MQPTWVGWQCSFTILGVNVTWQNKVLSPRKVLALLLMNSVCVLFFQKVLVYFICLKVEGVAPSHTEQVLPFSVSFHKR